MPGSMPPCRYTRCLLLLLHSAAAAEAVTLADFLYQRLRKASIVNVNNVSKLSDADSFSMTFNIIIDHY